MPVARKFNKSGKPYYVDTFTNRFVKASRWIKENSSLISEKKVLLVNKKEQASWNAIKRIKLDNKFLPKSVENFYSDIAKQAGKPLRPGTDLRFVFGEGFNMEKALSKVKLKQWLDSFDGREEKLFFAGQKRLLQEVKKGGIAVFIDRDGKRYEGFDAVNALNDYEKSVIDSAAKHGKVPIIIHKGMFTFKKQNGKMKEVYQIDVKDSIIRES